MVVAVGIDLVEVARVERMLGRGADRLARRVLTDREWAYCAGKASVAAHVAVRLAAKEAAFKALAGTEAARGIGWREIEVCHDGHRRPVLAFHGRAATRAAELGVGRVHVSLTHERAVAAAVVVLEREAPVGYS